MSRPLLVISGENHGDLPVPDVIEISYLNCDLLYNTGVIVFKNNDAILLKWRLHLYIFSEKYISEVGDEYLCTVAPKYLQKEENRNWL